MPQEIILFVIGCVSCLVLSALAIFTGYILYRRYIKGDYLINNGHIHTPCQLIHCNDIKTTAITLSQNIDHKHQRKRSQSVDSDILHEFVALEIDSQSSLQTSARSTKQSTEHSQSESSDDDDSSISPLATPKSKSHQESLHHRSDALQDIEQHMLQEMISHIDDSNSSPLRLCFNDINHVMDIIETDDEVEEEEKENAMNTEQKDEEDQVAITRMIVGSNVRIISDGSRSSISIPSTNFAYSMDASLYAEFMKQNDENKVEENKFEDREIYSNSDGKEDESSDRSSTATYHNVNEDYNQLHGIEAVPGKGSPNEIVENKDIVKRSVNIVRRLDKLNEMDEEDTNDLVTNMKKKISEYKRNIRNMDNSGSKSERRDSVNELKLNRVVKAKRLLFEKLNNNSS